MDNKKPQATHLPEAWHIHNTRNSVMDGMPCSRKRVGYPRAETSRVERNTVDADTLYIHKREPGLHIYKRCEKGYDVDEGSTVEITETSDEKVVLDRFGRSESEIRFKSLLVRLKGVEFSWNMAEKIVGGEKRLNDLLNRGKLHATKKPGAPNTMWRFDACEVISYVKPEKKFLK